MPRNRNRNQYIGLDISQATGVNRKRDYLPGFFTGIALGVVVGMAIIGGLPR